MRITRTSHRVAIGLTFLLTTAGAARGQEPDPFSRAKDFYASAAYEEALQVLRTLKTPSSQATEVAAYQVFCLVALGRSDEAKRAIESIVRTDPLYHPSESMASPRVRAFFEDVRRPLLPAVVRLSYSRAKDAYDRKEMAASAAEFDRVMKLLEELGASEDEGVADLRTLAGGFRDLARSAAAAAEATAAAEAAAAAAKAAAAAAAAPPPPRAPATIPVYGAGDADVRRPSAISQAMPLWRPENPVEERRQFSGALELLISEQGKVLSAVLLQSVHPRYDAILVKAAHDWTFRPATKNGKPVRYRLGLNVQLGR